MEQVTFSFFKDPITGQNPPSAEVTIQEVYRFMTGERRDLGGLSFTKLKKLSAEALKDSTAKKNLPYTTFSANFESGELRRLESKYNHSGLFVLDIDKLDNAEEVYKKSKEWEYTLLSFISPSGNGVKIVVSVDTESSMLQTYGHAKVCEAVIDIAEAYFGVAVDPLKDATRACFISATNEAFLRTHDCKNVPISKEKLEDQKKIEDSAEENSDDEPFETPITFFSHIDILWRGVSRRIGRLPKASRYSWLVTFVTECNKKGVDKKALLRYMKQKVQKHPNMQSCSAFDLNDYTVTLTNKVYRNYKNEFGIHGEWFLTNFTRYQFPTDGIDLAHASAYDLAVYAAENYREFFYQGGRFQKFNGRYFEAVADEMLDNDLLTMTEALLLRPSTARRAELFALLKSRMAVKDDRQKNLDRVLFKNGVLDIETRQFRKYSEEELLEARFTFQFDFDFAPKVKDDVWINMVKKVLSPNEKLEKADDSKEKSKLLYEYLGYALFGNGQAEKVLLLTGKGANGKSSLLNTIMEVMPKSILANVSPSQFGDRFTPHMLENKLLNIVSDISYNDLGSEDKFKKVVSNEVITVEEKYKKPRDSRLHCGHIFAANDDLEFKKNDAALDRRFLTILLEQVFYEEDRDYTLKDKLRNESVMQTIFNEILVGWDNFVENGYKFTVPLSSLEAQKERTIKTNHELIFFRDCLIYEEGARTSFSEIGELYREWCMINGVERGERIHFNRFSPKIAEYIQYNTAKGAKVINPKNKKQAVNLRCVLPTNISDGCLDNELSSLSGVTRRG